MTPPGFYTCGSVNSILRITGDPGIALTGELPWKWPLAMGFVIRGNALNSDANIELKTYHCPPDKEVMLVEDVIVEGNKIALGETGIKVEERCAGVLIHGNKFNEVAKPLDVSDEAHVLIIQNWVVLKYE